MTSRETLIIKLGALGDVLRTTPLLRRLPGPVTWVTDSSSLPLLAGLPGIHRLLTPSQSASLRGRRYRRIINFDEDSRACRLASMMNSPSKIGAWIEDGRITYCQASSPWFDMSLISRLGRREADRLKKRGQRVYQDYLFAACGLRFNGEEYLLPIRPARANPDAVALEARVGEKWPLKSWPGFAALRHRLGHQGLVPFELRARRRLSDYLADINRASIVVASDTLAMHVGLALRKQVVALFTCTSPNEIHGYGRLTKLVDRDLKKNFYLRTVPSRAKTSISLETALKAIEQRRKQVLTSLPP
ncbi:MAG: glycosyltransferase family 9 protein [Elusimicrobiota bacterium]